MSAGRAEATRDAILASARDVFVRRGYHAATVDDITQAACVAHGTFYRYFRNKQEALYGLVEQAMETLQLPERDWVETDMLAAIRADIAAAFRNYAAHRELTLIWREAASYDETVRELRRKVQQPFEARVAGSIDAAVESGRIPPVDVQVATRALIAMVDEFAYHWFTLEEHDSDLDEVAETVALLWYRALGPKD